MASTIIQIPSFGSASWKAPVSTVTDLPSNNSIGDARVTQDTSDIYVWSGSAWVSAGGGSSYTFADSIVNATGIVTLVNDSATPGNSAYYGTNSSGVLGYNTLVAPAGTLTGTILATNVVSSSLTSLGAQVQALSMGAYQINNVANPSSAQDAATKYYVDNSISGIEWKLPVEAYSTSNVALTGTSLVIDGYSVLNGNAVILSAQTTSSQNGVYSAAVVGSAYTLTLRETAVIGFAYLVLDGSTYAYDSFVVSALSPTTYTQFSGPTEYSFSTPLSQSGTTISINKATTSASGYLSSTDWNTFNGKQAAFSGLTTNGVICASSSSAVTSTSAGSQYQPLIANSSGAPSFQALNLGQSAAVTGILPVANTTVGTVAVGTVTTSATITWSSGSVFTMLLTNSDTCVVTFSGATSGQVIVVKVAQPGTTGSGVITWPTSYWAGGTIPTMTTGASAIDVYTFVYDGTNYYGSAVQSLAT